MSHPNLATLRTVADRLDGLGLDYAFVGGSIVNLLMDHPALSPARPTDDVDVILEAVTSQRYVDVEAKLRRLGFDHDMREKAPRCRWVLGNLTVDIMPMDGGFLGLNTAWFRPSRTGSRPSRTGSGFGVLGFAGIVSPGRVRNGATTRPPSG